MNIVSHQNKVPFVMVSPVLSEILIRTILCKEQGRKGSEHMHSNEGK